MNNRIKKELLEAICDFTDKNEIIVFFEQNFKEIENLNDLFSIVKRESIDTEFENEIFEITKALKLSFNNQLNDNLNIETINGFDIDTRYFDTTQLIEIFENIGFNPIKSDYFNPIKNNYYTNDTDIKNRLINKLFRNLDDLEKDEQKELKDSIFLFVINHIREHNQYMEIAYKSNPFKEKSYIDFSNQKMTLVSNTILPKIPKEIIDEDIVNDFKEHFDIDTMLDFILAARFGDTKKAYMWFRAPSDFGKSFFFQGILGDLGITTVITESELKQSYKGSPSGWNIEMFKNSFLLFVDEFSSNVKEFKNITHELSFSPKYRGKVSVDVFAKIFASAENVRSLNADGYIEEQYLNRFTFWREEKGKLTDRKKYVDNQLKYKKVIQWYTYNYLNKKINEYIELGEYESHNQANRELTRIIKSKPMKNTSNIEALINERLENFKQDYLYNKNENYEFNLIKNHFLTYNDCVYISNKGKVVEYFLKHYFDNTENQIVKHKEHNVILCLIDENRKQFKIDKINRAGYLWIQNKQLITVHNDNFGNDDLSDFINKVS